MPTTVCLLSRRTRVHANDLGAPAAAPSGSRRNPRLTDRDPRALLGFPGVFLGGGPLQRYHDAYPRGHSHAARPGSDRRSARLAAPLAKLRRCS
eukprot:7406927-Pyramimonas_sp.AAC.1